LNRADAIGWGVTLLASTCAGLALSFVAERDPAVPSPKREAAPLVFHAPRIERVDGAAQIRTGAHLLPALAGVRLVVPSVVLTPEPSMITLTRGQTRCSILPDSEAATTIGDELVLVRGRLIADSDAEPLTVHVPAAQAVVRGARFFVFSAEHSTSIASLEGAISVDLGGTERTLAAQRRLTITDQGASEHALAERLELAIDDVNRPAPHRRFRFRGHVTPGAKLLHYDGSAYVAVDVAADGAFEVKSWNDAPVSGELLAIDELGRRADVGVPSKPLGAYLDPLDKDGGTYPVADASAIELYRSPTRPFPAPAGFPSRGSRGHLRAEP
jgi:hypothetical protein